MFAVAVHSHQFQVIRIRVKVLSLNIYLGLFLNLGLMSEFTCTESYFKQRMLSRLLQFYHLLGLLSLREDVFAQISGCQTRIREW